MRWGRKGWAPPAADATWLFTFYNTTVWPVPGGSFATLPSGAQTVGGLGFYGFGPSPAMTADVQSWVDSPGTNHGWLILGNEGSPGTSKRFDASEHPTPSRRPRLVVDFTPPGGGPAPVLAIPTASEWSRLLLIVLLAGGAIRKLAQTREAD